MRCKEDSIDAAARSLRKQVPALLVYRYPFTSKWQGDLFVAIRYFLFYFYLAGATRDDPALRASRKILVIFSEFLALHVEDYRISGCFFLSSRQN